MANAKGRLKGESVYSIGSTIRRTKDGKTLSGSIVDNVTPVKRNLDEGLHVLNPNELAGVLIPTLRLEDGKIHGYERPISRPHIRRIAMALEDGKTVDPPVVSAYKNSLWTVDGQHRILGAIIADVPLKVLVEKLDADQMRQRYAQQIRAMKINPSNLIMSGTDPLSTYIQNAIIDKKHSWYGLVTEKSASKVKLTAKQAADAARRYSQNVLSENMREKTFSEFDPKLGDEMATLLRAFGSKEGNPMAFKPKAVRAITYAAVIVIRRQGSRKTDVARWNNWMVNFPFHEYAAVSKSRELAFLLVRHWNKKLSKANKIEIPEEIQ